jgi:FMN phosphatase YigB (HAD superfamily)
MATSTLQLKISPDNYKLLIFDLDGTLYDQRRLRNKMIRVMIHRFLCFKIGLLELKIISSFRKQRELHKGYSSLTLDSDQYSWSSEELGIPVSKVRDIVEEYMFILPLKFLKDSIYKGVGNFIATLRAKGFKIAIYSDYPVDEKIEAMGLSADKTFCSTDYSIHSLKPNGDALLSICKYFDCDTKEAIYFGDREDTDGESAKMAGIEFMKVDITKARKGEFFGTLKHQI